MLGDNSVLVGSLVSLSSNLNGYNCFMFVKMMFCDLNDLFVELLEDGLEIWIGLVISCYFVDK